MKIEKPPFLILVSCFLAVFLAGCAGIPIRGSVPTYNINGITYVSLIPLCNSRNINWDYDTFTRKLVISKEAHRINLMVGESLILVDDRPRYLRHPIELYQGTVAVPYSFKEQVLDTLFRETPLIRMRSPLSKIKRVVIDAGHGGNDPGAIGKTGLREKDVNLDIAKRLGSLLKAQGIGIIFTRSSDDFIPLAKRVAIANRAKADIFISIHSNANLVRSRNGFEVYYISSDINDSKRALLAAKNTSLDLSSSCFAGYSLALRATLWDMIYTYSRAESIGMARSICQEVNRQLDTKILGVKGAGFYVLKGARMPAVLVEVGFVSNREEERMLRNDYYRQKIAESITEGILDYAQDIKFAEATR